MTIVSSGVAPNQEEAAPKGDASYSWFVWTSGKSANITKKTGKTHELKKGDLWGVRPSSNKKALRVIVDELGPTHVFTLDLDMVNLMIKQSKLTVPK